MSTTSALWRAFSTVTGSLSRSISVNTWTGAEGTASLTTAAARRYRGKLNASKPAMITILGRLFEMFPVVEYC